MLQAIARTIQNTFNAYDIDCTVQEPPQTFQTSTHVFFGLQKGYAQKVAHITGLRSELDEVLTAAVGQSVAVRFGLAPLSLSIPRPDARPQNLAQVFARWSRTPVHVEGDRLLTLLGEGINGRKVKMQLLDLASPNTPHVFVAGTTGSGKTNAIAQMVLATAYLHTPAQVGMILIDPKGIDRTGAALPELDGLPHLLRSTITDMVEAVSVLRWLVAEMDRRVDTQDVTAMRLLMVVDELADLVTVGGHVVNDAMARILAKGRGVGIHVIGATQKPTADILGSVVKANFPVRFVGRVNGKIDANVAAQRPGSEAERSAGRGDFVLVTGDFRRVQAYHVPKADVAGWVSAIRKRHAGTAGPVRLTTAEEGHISQKQGGLVRSAGLDRSETADLLPFGPPQTAEDVAHVRRVYEAAGSYNETLRRLGWLPGNSKATALEYVKSALAADVEPARSAKLLRMYPREAA